MSKIIFDQEFHRDIEEYSTWPLDGVGKVQTQIDSQFEYKQCQDMSWLRKWDCPHFVYRRVGFSRGLPSSLQNLTYSSTGVSTVRELARWAAQANLSHISVDAHEFL